MSSRREQEMQYAVRIPADVDRDDRVLANLTARQLAILTVAGIVLYALYAATRAVLPLPLFGAVAVPVAIAAAMLALGTRDGLPLDRLLVAAVRQRMTPQVQVAAPGGISAAPAWITAHAAADTERVMPSALELPAEAVTDATAGPGTAGVIDLGADGLAAVCVCSTVNFALRTPREQEALVASFGRYLHSLAAPVQILVRAQRLDLSGQIAELREHAGGLPHPALERAALEHADYLAHLAAQSDLLRRQVLLILREPLHTTATAGLAALPARLLHRRQAQASTAARHAAETRLGRRLAETAGLLSAAGIVTTPLDAAQASAILTAATNPDTLLPPNAGLAAPDEVITTASDLYADDPLPTDWPAATDADPQPDNDPGINEEEDLWWAR